MATPEEIEKFNEMLRGHVVDDSLTIDETIAKEKKFMSFLLSHIKLHNDFVNHLERTKELATIPKRKSKK